MRNAILSSYILSLIFIPTTGFGQKILEREITRNEKGQEFYKDLPYRQAYSVKYYFDVIRDSFPAVSISINRDQQIRILSGRKLIVPDNGKLFYDGKFVD